MSRWMIGRAISLIGMLGFPFSGALAQTYNSQSFATEAAARDYLRQNPTGPRANAAFLALSEFRLMRANPGLTRDQIIAGFNNRVQTAPVRRRTPGTPASVPVNDPY